MPEFRKIRSRRWVIVAEERGTKPYQFGEGWERKFFPVCFARRESCTPPEVFSIRKRYLPNERGWRVRVVA